MERGHDLVTNFSYGLSVQIVAHNIHRCQMIDQIGAHPKSVVWCIRMRICRKHLKVRHDEVVALVPSEDVEGHDPGGGLATDLVVHRVGPEGEGAETDEVREGDFASILHCRCTENRWVIA